MSLATFGSDWNFRGLLFKRSKPFVEANQARSIAA
jgi:hypothetical protein